MSMSYDADFARGEPALERWLKLTFILGLHGVLIIMLANAAWRRDAETIVSRLDVRVIEETPPPKPKPEPVRAKPLPMTPHPVQAPVPRREPAPAPQPAPSPPVLTAAPDAPAPAATYTVPLQAPAPVKSDRVAAAPPSPPPVTAPRFDADYLHNPAPAYPPAARRAGHEGRVLLRVLVTAQGRASTVQIQTSSGHARLDEAALETVRQWRFVPAKRGAEAIEDWVLVPIVFQLER
jgi:periplasmic protein TonB